MRCPFLREAQVKSCCASPFKKMIPRTPDQASSERCSGVEWKSCPASKEYRQDVAGSDRCPFLQESLVQYCAAAPVPRFIPYSDGPLSRCSNDRHVYCESFLSVASPGNSTFSRPLSAWTPSNRESVRYSPNHMWIDTHDDGSCHVGIDAFLATFLQHVQRLSYVSTRSVCFPSAVLTVNGVDLQ